MLTLLKLLHFKEGSRRLAPPLSFYRMVSINRYYSFIIIYSIIIIFINQLLIYYYLYSLLSIIYYIIINAIFYQKLKNLSSFPVSHLLNQLMLN